MKLDDATVDRELEAAALQTITALLDHTAAAVSAASATPALSAGSLPGAANGSAIAPNSLQLQMRAGQPLEQRMAASINAEIAVALAQAEARAYAEEDDDGEEDENGGDDEDEQDQDNEPDPESGPRENGGSQRSASAGVDADVDMNGGRGYGLECERVRTVFGMEVLGRVEGEDEVEEFPIPLRARKGKEPAVTVLAGMKRKR